MDYPSIQEQMYNLAESATKIVISAAQGNDVFVDEETANKRMIICQSCPGDYFDHSKKRCKACGCWMEKKFKLTAMECPHNYWQTVTSAKEDV